ncbi:hypothetical protein [Klebsiella michiganensis]|uniref:hypothetical protein n=1 Tax=Klebsiella michiganensis TaxID=1134687 RepID=UPI001F115C1C|nr:hypothetical protein [Klebsiella michiganensis]
MTDITELAQSLKRRSTSANEFGESLYVKADDVLALVEALEKAQTKAIEQGRTACELFDEVTALRQRIAELESSTVTVKLPEPFKLAKSSSGLMYYFANEVNESLTAAGIKWEAE